MTNIFEQPVPSLFGTISKRILAASQGQEGLCDRLFQRIDGRPGRLRHSLKELVLDNVFLDDAQRTYILGLFCSAMRTYNAFARLAYLFRIRHARVGGSEVDLQLVNKISSFPASQRATVFQGGTLFCFRLTDLLRLWREALGSRTGTRPTPSHPRNPYTGLEFKPVQLFNIYFQLAAAPFAVPPQIESLFRLGMDLRRFTRTFWPLLRDRAVERHVKEGDLDTLFFEVAHMIQAFAADHGRAVDGRLQRHKKRDLVNGLRECLKIWLQGRRAQGAPFRPHRRRVRAMLANYFDKHPSAGRRVMRVPARPAWAFRFSPPRAIMFEV